MARHLLQRFLLTLPALWLVLTLVFLMIHIVPGDPVKQMLGEGAAPGELVQLRHALGLDLPLHVQYGRYLRQLARGDFGTVLQVSGAGAANYFRALSGDAATGVSCADGLRGDCDSHRNARRLPSRTYCGPRRRRVCSFRMIGDSR